MSALGRTEQPWVRVALRCPNAAKMTSATVFGWGDEKKLKSPCEIVAWFTISLTL